MTDHNVTSAVRRVKTPADKKKVSTAYSTEERRHIIREYEKRFSGRGNEDSEAWIQLIRESRTYSDMVCVFDE